MGSAMTAYEPDWTVLPSELGAPPRAVAGLIALANDSGIEDDFRAWLDGSGIKIATTRVFTPAVSNISDFQALEGKLGDATVLLMPQSDLDWVAFGCTSATVAMGVAATHKAIQKGRPGVGISDPISATLAALDYLRCRRIALITPYRPAINVAVEKFLLEAGIKLVAKGCFPLDTDRERSRLTSDTIIKIIEDFVDGLSVDGIFIACTALQTVAVVDELERRTGKPVVTSNQALAWHTVKACGVKFPFSEGKGFLFSRS